MLVNLYIENIAVIEKASIDFDMGFNVMTGETGAGKSIVIDSINAILGERANRDMIRTGETRARVSALFSNPGGNVAMKMENYGIEMEEDGSLLLQREFTVEGKSIFRINGKPVTAGILRDIGRQLINIHGQHDNQALLSPQSHIAYLDSMADMEEDRKRYQQCYEKAVAFKRELKSTMQDETEKLRQIDLLRYQIEELEQAGLKTGEQEKLTQRKNQLLNAERIAQAVTAAREMLSGSDERAGALLLAQNAAASLSEASHYLKELAPLAQRLTDASYELEDILSELRETELIEEPSPQELDEIEARLDQIYRLSLKYGQDEEEMLAFLEQAKDKLAGIEHSDERRQQLETAYREQVLQAKALAEVLTQKRWKAAKLFEEQVAGELSFLNMPNVTIKVQISPCKLYWNGGDEVLFTISTNPGEPLKPLSKIASGGELSRIMLAIKNVLADKDDIDTLIFDEIDTGISGRAAQKVGIKLHQVARNRQIICVTHLAQIAAHGDRHLLIEKGIEKGRSVTTVLPLDQNGRVREIARIMSGSELSDIQLKSAQELLENARKTDKTTA